MRFSASTRRDAISSFSRCFASAASIARASSLRNAWTSVPSSGTAASGAGPGATTSSRPPCVPVSGDGGAGAGAGGVEPADGAADTGTSGTGAARAGAAVRELSRFCFHAKFWRCTSATAVRSSSPISLRIGMRRVTPAFNPLTFLVRNAWGFASTNASIMRWTLMESSGRNRNAIAQSVSVGRTGP